VLPPVGTLAGLAESVTGGAAATLTPALVARRVKPSFENRRSS
jgi:hypothetical protein